MEQTSQVIFEKNSIEFVTVAAEYCGFIERSQEFDKKSFVDTALKILPLLYLKASLIPECEQIGEDDLEIVVTEDDYEYIRRSVARIMGAQDDYLEVFHPDRMASRILGMGDVLSIIEKAEEAFDMDEAEKLEKQLRKGEFDLNDYLAQLKQIKKMGSFSSILKMIPGMNKLKDVKVDDKEFNRIEAIICSMTAKERRNPKILNGSRRIRIAKGSGTTVQQINQFMNSFEMTQKMMKQMKTEKGMRNMMKNLKGFNPEDLKF